MDSVLIVASSEKSRSFLVDFVRADNLSQITEAKSGNGARRMIGQMDFELVVVNTPLSDEFGDDLALLAAQETMAGVVLIVKAEMADDISAKVENDGALVVAKPLNRQLFYQALRLAAASRRRMLGLKKENVKLQKKIEEIRLVDRAKCALIQYLNMTEAQAHRYIEKQAMDLRTTRGEIANGILHTYEK